MEMNAYLLTIYRKKYPRVEWEIIVQGGSANMKPFKFKEHFLEMEKYIAID